MKRLGIFGGTFNPIHTAHLIVAEEVLEEMGLDKVIFIPSANPPHKNNNETADASERLKLIEMAIQGNENFESSDIEIKNSRFSKSYTVDTLQSLSEQYKKNSAKLYLIIGMDNLIELHTWKEPKKLFSYAEVIVLNRPGYSVNDVKNNFVKKVRVMTVSYIDISSTRIRNKIKEKKSIRYLVPDAVEKYILENKLYS